MQKKGNRRAKVFCSFLYCIVISYLWKLPLNLNSALRVPQVSRRFPRFCRITLLAKTYSQLRSKNLLTHVSVY